jgi:repressor LexA
MRRPRSSSNPILTPKQKEVADFISAFSQENGYAPSQTEIAKKFGFKSLGTVQNYLVRLERQGILRKTWNARRGMQIVPPTRNSDNLDTANFVRGVAAAKAVPLPLLGRVAAGRPIEAIETMETLEVPASMLRGGENFVLRVTGDSMIEDGILNGDYVVIKKQDRAENGQTVVALIGNEATIKRFYKKAGKVELHPANPAFQPIVIESLVENPEFKIEGVLVGVIRQMS